MNNRLALIGIIIEDLEQATRVNELLHTASEYIIGRMGLPYKDKKVNVISVIIDAPQDVIASLSGKIGAIHGVNVKTMYTQVGTNE